MNITQLWHRIVLSFGGLTLAGIGMAVTWSWNIRKLNAEIREINLRIETMQQSQLLEQLSSTLINRSNCLDPNNNVLAKVDWSLLLPVEHRNLIDAVLLKLMKDGLARETVAGSWMIGYGVKRFRG